jgi:hypothetical protein
MIVFKQRLLLPQLHIEYWDDLGNQYAEVPAGATVVDNPTEAEAMKALREYRNKQLIDSDYTQLDDAPLTPAQKEAYREYRQQWRDYPETVNSETWTAPTYPTKPVL